MSNFNLNNATTEEAWAEHITHCPLCGDQRTGTGFTRRYCTEIRFSCQSVYLWQGSKKDSEMVQSRLCRTIRKNTYLRELLDTIRDRWETKFSQQDGFESKFERSLNAILGNLDRIDKEGKK